VKKQALAMFNNDTEVVSRYWHLLRPHLISGNVTALWSSCRIILAEAESYRPERTHQKALDEQWTDQEPFKDNLPLKRLSDKMTKMGLIPNFRQILELDEITVQDILADTKIGVGARQFVNTVRDEESFWAKCLKNESI